MLTAKDGNGSVSCQISEGFDSRRFGFGNDFSPTIFRFGAPEPIEFSFEFGFFTHGYPK